MNLDRDKRVKITIRSKNISENKDVAHLYRLGHISYWIDYMETFVMDDIWEESTALAFLTRAGNELSRMKVVIDAETRQRIYKLIKTLSTVPELMECSQTDFAKITKAILNDLYLPFETEDKGTMIGDFICHRNGNSTKRKEDSGFDLNLAMATDVMNSVKIVNEEDDEGRFGGEDQPNKIQMTHKIEIIEYLLDICLNVPKLCQQVAIKTCELLEGIMGLGDAKFQTIVIRGYTQFSFYILRNSFITRPIKVAGTFRYWIQAIMKTYEEEDLPLFSAIIEYYKMAVQLESNQITSVWPDLLTEMTQLLENILCDSGIYLSEDEVYGPFDIGRFDKDETQEANLDIRHEVFDEVSELFKYMSLTLSSHDFALFFSNIFPVLERKFKNSSATLNNLFISGIIAESMRHVQLLTPECREKCQELLSKCVEESFVAVRNNGIYGLGKICFNTQMGDEWVWGTLQPLLFQYLGKEDEPRVKDNIVAAFTRMIITHGVYVDLDTVLPELIKNLPLQEDLMENAIVFSCFRHLYEKNPGSLTIHLRKIIDVAKHVLENKSSLDYEGSGPESGYLIDHVECFLKEVM